MGTDHSEWLACAWPRGQDRELGVTQQLTEGHSSAILGANSLSVIADAVANAA